LIPIETLPSEDFPLLKNIEEGYVPSKDSIVIVGKVGDEIVARMMLIGVAHIEGTWIKPEVRSGSLLHRLMHRMEQEAKAAGITTLLAYSENDEVDSYLERLKFSRSPLRIWKKEV
jgi:N-acetylglutamate synthase-like GNAT family acetyltransferase